MGSAQQVNIPKYLICAQQTQNRTNVTDKKINVAIFDNLDLRKKYYFEKDGQRYPRNSLPIKCKEKNYIEQYKGLKFFLDFYIGEPLINHFISYPDMKTNYPHRNNRFETST